MVTIRHATSSDATTWLRLRRALWPDGTEAEHREEIEQFFRSDLARDPWAALLAEDTQGRIVGLAELSIRPYAEGCRTRRVAYLEGWYVVPESRGRGVGRALVEAAQEWGRGEECSEFASDADPENAESIAAHLAVGFDDVGQVRCFRKDL